MLMSLPFEIFCWAVAGFSARMIHIDQLCSSMAAISPSCARPKAPELKNNYLSHWANKLFRIFARELKVSLETRRISAKWKWAQGERLEEGEKQWKMARKYVGGMIRKMLYFLLRRINFSPEKPRRKKRASGSRKKGEPRGKKTSTEELVEEKEKSRSICIQ